MKIHNFNAGPASLPDVVLKEAANAVINFDNSGLSILEIAHRSPEFKAVLAEAKDLTLDILGLKDKGYQVLFLQGGARMEFLRIPVNLMRVNGKAAFLDTGIWSSGAMKEAESFGLCIEVASSKDRKYCYLPKEYSIPEDADYFYCTSNNTISGTQITHFPETEVSIVCDMTSDIFSRNMDFSRFDLIFAAAQKNIGIAGVTLLVIKESILGKTNRNIASILDFQEHIKADNMYNTPPVFAIYTAMLTLRWIKAEGGIAIIEKRNQEKARLLYAEIDRNELFEGTADRLDRSKMNATFILKDESHKKAFDQFLKERGIYGLEGHRFVGGYRASLYNAVTSKSVNFLVSVLQEFEKQNIN
ncbi:3-phosphoserine/phosphohydroxythreonine transaminase [Flavobacterium ardleyense]|uniref:3-phosphoserine/phosphohydroxythreonine transaminase n=1 Tax=Flavobacterium ardleyense TaxID=2038737 RepID=UPI00298C1E3E|nr:3-phosphoserine/phosphohydroxythreonine transaminase [Flavobacterium ardleyense]